MPRSLLLVVGLVSLFAACGGETSGSRGPTDDGDGGSPSSDAGPMPDTGLSIGCPEDAPPSGGACSHEGVSCPYSDPICGGPTCTCENGAWSCVVPPCVQPETCPELDAENGQMCSDVGAVCDSPVHGICTEEQCRCEPAGTWSCFLFDCPDGGTSDGEP